jgi:ribosomal protein S25
MIINKVEEERIREKIRDKTMKERRHKERRNIRLVSPFVIVDRKGRSRSVDRRRVPDRRLNNIRVEFIPLDIYYNSEVD